MVNILHFTTLALLAVTNARPRNPRQTGSLPISCRGRERLTNTEGTMTSPNYPGHYPANSSCNWIISPLGNSSQVSLAFISFSINSGPSRCRGARCRCDFVQVKGLDPPPSGGAAFNAKYCDSFPPPRTILVTTKVRIRFVSDSTQEGTGFVLRYNTVQATISPTKPSDFSGDGNTQAGLRHTLTSETSRSDQERRAVSTRQPTSQNFNSTGQIPFSDSATISNTTDPVITMVPQLHTVYDPENGSIVVIPPGTLPGETISKDVPPSTVPPSFQITGRDFDPGSIWSNPSKVVIFAEERKAEEEKVPDVIILGPSIPVVMIFVIVVAAIAWWNYKFDSEELSRYASYQTSAAFKKRHKQRMDAIQKGKLYSDMTRDWRGQSISLSSPGFAGPHKRKKASFAGKLLELAETVRTPRPSRPCSMATEETVPLNPMHKMAPGQTSVFLDPSAAESSSASRPGSTVLREALVKILGGIDSGENDDSDAQSKRNSKRVSFNEEEGHPLLGDETRPPERIMKSPEKSSLLHGQNSEQDEHRLSTPVQIPCIVVRQASDETDDTTESPVIRRRKQAIPDSPTEVCEPGANTCQSDGPESCLSKEDEVFVEEAPSIDAAAPEDDLFGDKQEPVISDDDVSEEFDEDPSETSLLFPDLEDFLLNLDKDSLLQDPPYSCAGHIQDILRKSYGDDGPSNLRPEAVLPVPEEYLGMIRGGRRSSGDNEADKEAEQLDDVD